MRLLTLSELLRPWASNGVTHLLVGPLATPDPSGQSLSQGGARQKPSVEKPLEQSISGGAFFAELPFEQWPVDWQTLFHKTKKAPVVWTYSSLGFDLSGKGLPARSACLRTIIGRLGLQKGSSSFWPASLPDANGVLKSDVTVFLSALGLLAPKFVIVGGEGMVTNKMLPLTLYTPFTQQVHQGRLYILLPSFSRMIDDTSLIDKTCTYLRATLDSLVSLQKP